MPSSMSQLFGDRPVFGDGTRTCQEEGADVRIELGIPGEATVLCNFLQTWKIDPPIFGVNHLSTMSTDTTLCCSVHTRPAVVEEMQTVACEIQFIHRTATDCPLP